MPGPPSRWSQRVYRLLSDRQFHSGTQLAADCDVSRSAIWKAIAALRALGVTVHAVATAAIGCRAATALLERERIVEAAAARRSRRDCARGSPRLVAPARPTAICCSAGATAAGQLRFPDGGIPERRPRPARRAAGLRRRAARSACRSAGASRALPRDIGALSLAIGVCALRALAQIGVTSGAALKWPNDLVVGERKTRRHPDRTARRSRRTGVRRDRPRTERRAGCGRTASTSQSAARRPRI